MRAFWILMGSYRPINSNDVRRRFLDRLLHGKVYNDFSNGEFDPGSERTLAACFIHASRARKLPSGSEYSGARVSNTWVICLRVRDNLGKLGLIPDETTRSSGLAEKDGLFMKAIAWR